MSWSICDNGFENFPFVDSWGNFGTTSTMEESSSAAIYCGEKCISWESEEVCCIGSSETMDVLEAITILYHVRYKVVGQKR